MRTICLLLTLACAIVSQKVYSQWGPYPYGTNYITNTNTGGVVVKLDAPTPASIPSWGNWTFFAYGTASHTSGTASKVWGAYLLSLNTKAGTLTEAIGSNSVAGVESSATGTVTNAYGVYSGVQSGAGTVNNGYGVYVGNIAAQNDWGVYQSGSDDTNYFAGNMGIGTTNTGSFKLAVEGKIGAREIQVTLTNPFPDYVFESDYRLMPLSELQLYISLHKHLPDVPSAKKVEKDGLNLGEMNVLLLKKVEELTLYILQQEKRIAALEEKLSTGPAKQD